MRSVVWLVVLAALAGGGTWAVWKWRLPGVASDNVLTATATRGELVITVTERGELESSQSVQVLCEIEGGGKLISIVPEGTHVTKGTELCRFATDVLLTNINTQEVKWEAADGKVKTAVSELEVQKNKEQSEIAKADLALTLAKIDYESYEEGEFKVELDKRKGQLELGKKEQAEAEDNLAFTRGLVKKGFAQLEQIRALELNVESKKYAVSQQTADLDVLTRFTKIRKVTELKAKAEDAEREMDRTKKSQAAATEKADSELKGAVKTAELEKQQLDRLKLQLDKCVVTAPQDGIVIYFSRPWDDESRIKPGVTINEQSPIVTLPDLDRMQVKLRIHESVIKKVQPNLTATMIVEAVRTKILHGKVKTVGSVAENDGWRGGGTKEYSTEVSIEDLPKDDGLRPGMSADVKILIKTIDNALTVPVQAVTELDSKYVAYVVTATGAIEKREVTVGDSNEQNIQVLTGLETGDRVALDARTRAAAEVKRKAGQQQPGKAEPTQPKPQSMARA